jgi:hypothetical protein
MVHKFLRRAVLFIAVSAGVSAFVAATHAGESRQMLMVVA